MQRHKIRLGLISIFALLAIIISLFQLMRHTEGIHIERIHIGATPATLFTPKHVQHAPVVIIAHGFAGSQQLMHPFAVTLARNGYIALSFDFPGHGRHPQPIAGELADYESRSRMLMATMADIVTYAQALPHTSGELALLGHSMASDTVMRYASENVEEIDVTIAVSPFSDHSRHDAPRNLLIIYGALEPKTLQALGSAAIAHATPDGEVEPEVRYGEFADGTARQLSLARGVEHIGVLYSPESLEKSLHWLNDAFAFEGGDGFLDKRGPWLALLLLALLILARPLARLLPRLSRRPLGSGIDRWRTFLLIAILPAILTPLLLWPMPSGFLPILLGDYLVLHFGLYGILTLIGLLAIGRLHPKEWFGAVPRGKLLVSMLAAGIYITLGVALVMDTFVSSFIPIAERIPLVLAMFVGTLLFFAMDEWFTHGAATLRGAYALSKVLFVLSLIAATLLSLEQLFFLIIIIPAIVVFFIVHGFFSRWLYKRTYHPLVGGFANAMAFAWAIAVTFPMVTR